MDMQTRRQLEDRAAWKSDCVESETQHTVDSCWAQVWNMDTHVPRPLHCPSACSRPQLRRAGGLPRCLWEHFSQEGGAALKEAAPPNLQEGLLPGAGLRRVRALWALRTLSILKKLGLQEAGQRPSQRAFECFLGEGVTA